METLRLLLVVVEEEVEMLLLLMAVLEVEMELQEMMTGPLEEGREVGKLVRVEEMEVVEVVVRSLEVDITDPDWTKPYFCY